MNFARYTASVVSAPFKLGGRSIADGFDCFSLVFDYLIKRGASLSWEDKREGMTASDYVAEYTKNPDIFKVAINHIQDSLKEVPPSKAVAGDILLLQRENSDHFFAIDGGNGKAVTSTIEKGVMLIKKQYYTTKRAFRCQV